MRSGSWAPVLTLCATALAAQTPPLGSEFRVNTYTTSDQVGPAVALDGSGNFVVVWQSTGEDGSGTGVFGRRYDASGFALGPEFLVNTYTSGNQGAPTVGRDSTGNFVVLWQSAQDGSQNGIYGQRYNSTGVPQGPEFRANTYTTGQQNLPAVAMDPSGSFVVVWQSDTEDGASYGIFGQRYDGAGIPQGPEFQVNTYTTEAQRLPAVAMDSLGSFVVVWQSYTQDGSTYNGVFGQRYNPSGIAQGPEFQVNTYTTSDQSHPAVARDDLGNFVVLWQSYTQDGSGWGIFGRPYNGSGVPQGAEFRVNTYLTGFQVDPAVAMEPSGDFVVAWASVDQDGYGYGVFGQRYDASGRPRGSEFLVNAFTPAWQRSQAIAIDGRGQFIAAWDSEVQDGSGHGVFFRRGGFPDARPMKVDERASAGSSNLNAVLESGESVTVDPAWWNPGATPLAVVGLESNFTGPAGPVYTLNDSSADYGSIAAGSSNNCFDATGNCLEVTVSGTRPTAHWDAKFDELLSTMVTKTWTLHVGESFADAPTSNQFYGFIENIFHNGVTAGGACGGYCPGDATLRKQMAVFVLKAREGQGYVPPAATGVFNDVPASDPFARWIEELYNRGVVAGCSAPGGPNYCPNDTVLRQQMSVFLLKTLLGASYAPPIATGIFGDVPVASPFAPWIEDLDNRGITGGCNASPLLYCPSNSVTRGQMAVFLVKTFGLQLYGP